MHRVKVSQRVVNTSSRARKIQTMKNSCRSCSATAGSTTAKRKRCCLCPRGVVKKVRLECEACRRNVCSDHSTQQPVCEQCLSIPMQHIIQVNTFSTKNTFSAEHDDRQSIYCIEGIPGYSLLKRYATV